MNSAASEEVPVTLHLEKAESLPGPWETVPLDSMAMTPDGGMMDPVESPQAWYRLRIEQSGEAESSLAVPLNQVPQEVTALAVAQLQDLALEEPDWVEAELHPVVFPLYNPAVAGGELPAYYEFKVVGLGPQPEPPDQQGFGLSAPLSRPDERGYILVSNGRHDVPFPQYATSGIPYGERLLQMAKGVATRLVRYDSNFWVAEDSDGNLRASIGSTPFRVPEEVLEFAGPLPNTEILDNERWQESPDPMLPTTAYASYAAFKDDYVHGDLHNYIRKAKTKRVVFDWAAVDNVAPPNIQIPVMEDTHVLPGMQIASWEFEDNLVAAWKHPDGGLWMTGSLDGTTFMQVIDEDGEIHYYVLVIGEPIEQLGWQPWHTEYALGACGLIPHYWQVHDLAGCCPDGASGCGPTAWAMFYGFWDLRGVRNLIGGREFTPFWVNSDVEHCIRRCFDLTGCWCTAINGQAATNPWQMDDGDAYAAERGESITASMNWSVPLTSIAPRRVARDAIRMGRPAIVGTGFFEHYPMAYAYRYRRYKAGRITWWTQIQWKVYQAWDPEDACEWVDATTCWFGMNGSCE